MTDRVNWRRGVKLFGNDDAVARMRAALEQQGVTFASYRPFTPPNQSTVPELLEEFRIPQAERQAITKIALPTAVAQPWEPRDGAD